MDQALLIPRRIKGSRLLLPNQHFRPVRRSITTSDCAWCGWVWFNSIPTLRAIFRNLNAASKIGWGVYVATNGALTVYWALEAGATSASSSAGVFVANTWNFVAVNMDRSGNATGYVNDMATPVVTADISGAVAYSWISAADPWILGGTDTNITITGRIARIGHIVGGLLSEDNRTELYGSGRGLLYSQMSAGLATLFSGQDYYDCTETSGALTNQATGARPAPAFDHTTATAAIKSSGKPRR